MSDLSCRTARLMMQAPRDLAPLDARRLDRHLLQCRECAALHRSNGAIDRLLDQSLVAAAENLSVRQITLRLLQAGGAGHGERGSSQPRVRSSQPHPGGISHPHNRRNSIVQILRPRKRWLLAPIAALAVIAGLVVPQISSHLGGAPVPAGAAWRVIRADIAFPLAVDPTRKDHLLAAANGGVYQSWNAGESWQALAPIPPGIIRALAIDASEPAHYLVAVKNSVYVSTDAGKRWLVTARGLPGAGNMFLLQDRLSPNVFYLGPSVLWRSDDHGMTWHVAGQNIFAPDGIQSLNVAPDGDLFTAIWNGGIAISHDGGRTWTPRSTGLNRRVVDVASDARTVWAATWGHGLYRSRDSGLSWRRNGFTLRFATSVLDEGGLLLAGGDGGLFRSMDGGRSWQAATVGLPLAPYVYDLVADRHRPGRIYVSLNTDGIFRSDDGGQHWTAASAGLPLNVSAQTPRSVLFRRSGVLWITDGRGTDPGNLTVDRAVQTAAISPDGAAVVYVTGSTAGWAARLVGAGGSAARTVASGSGALPTQLLWSPTSAAVAVGSQSRIFVTDLRSGSHNWPAPSGEVMLGWSADGRHLLFWVRSRSQVVARDPSTGTAASLMPGIYPSRPVPAPDGKHLALIASGYLYVGTWNRVLQAVAPLASSCSLGSWSADSARLLMRCGHVTEERAIGGRILARVRLPGHAFWAPQTAGSSSSALDLLYFHHGLRRWSPHAGSTLLVPNATSVQPAM